MPGDQVLQTYFEKVCETLCSRRKNRVLEAIAWPRGVEERFFASGEEQLPNIDYRIDYAALDDRIADLSTLEKQIKGNSSVLSWLREIVEAHLEGALLIRSLGTREFYTRSKKLYGSARSPFFDGPTRNIDLAEHLFGRLRIHGWDEASDPESKPISASDFRDRIMHRIAARNPRMDIRIEFDESLAAKVVAGMSRIRIRPDATFTPLEIKALWHHEVETHALSAQNGAAQKTMSFLQSGGPRSTRTQEGLAIFSELYNRVLSIERLERLVQRVRLVDMAEQGASFIDLYRHLRETGREKRDAYFDAQRVCRGGLCEGGAPFTKDVCYLAGLLEVYAFLAAVIRGGFRDEVELVVCGRIALGDIAVLAELRAAGILQRPKYLPRWLSEWQTLLPYFAFTSFMDGIDLAPVEKHFQALIEVASSAAPPPGYFPSGDTN